MFYRLKHPVRHQWFTLHLFHKIPGNSHEIKFNISPTIESYVKTYFGIARDIWKFWCISTLIRTTPVRAKLLERMLDVCGMINHLESLQQESIELSMPLKSEREWKGFPEFYDCNITFHKSLENTQQRKMFLPFLLSNSSCRCRSRCSSSW